MSARRQSILTLLPPHGGAAMSIDDILNPRHAAADRIAVLDAQVTTVDQMLRVLAALTEQQRAAFTAKLGDKP